YSFTVVYFGTLLQFPEWVQKMSPFGHVSRIPIENFDWPTAAVMTGVGAALLAIGFIGYNKRDIDG
ncbi:MAG TPA: ABC transporter permease, partial [Planococcus sp. (in: firmicutes)]|nr:ABC transporter permease [Planococcus sp. (in: firmicutes)]